MPVSAFTEMPSDTVVRVGMLKVFACLTSEDRQITWQRNGRYIPENEAPRVRALANDYLLISPVNVNDSAKYTCVASEQGSDCVTRVSARLVVYSDVNEGGAYTIILS